MHTRERLKILTTSQSQAQAEAIARVIPGGVNSPFRSFREVGGHEIFFASCQGRTPDGY